MKKKRSQLPSQKSAQKAYIEGQENADLKRFNLDAPSPTFFVRAVSIGLSARRNSLHMKQSTSHVERA